MEPRHDSVLMNEVLAGLDLVPTDVVVDGTVGGAGHFMAMLKQLGPHGVLIGIDADAAALERARVAMDAEKGSVHAKVHLVEDNFRNLDQILDGLQVESISKALFDLGWSGFQLAGGKGFSFQQDEPLLMTYGSPKEGETAADIVNSYSEEDLADLIYTLGEERHARRIAKAIVEHRKKERILTTGALAAVVATAVRTNGRINPATKTFQALRIAVNQELSALTDVLASAFNRLAPGGRLAVISFHSIEDRIVKDFFRARADAGEGTLVYKKPIAPSSAELAANRRARSAKLRVIEKSSAVSARASEQLVPAYA